MVNGYAMIKSRAVSLRPRDAPNVSREQAHADALAVHVYCSQRMQMNELYDDVFMMYGSVWLYTTMHGEHTLWLCMAMYGEHGTA